MDVRHYAPSSQFTVIALALLISVGLVYGAELFTHPKATTAGVSVGAYPTQPSDADNWEATLYSIQAQNASSSIKAPDQNTVQNLLAAAQNSNLTESIGKTILINLNNAKLQGLGDDVPTQEQIIAAAAAQVKNQQTNSSNFTITDLTVVPVSDASLRAYGNGVIQALSKHPEASERATLLSIDYAVEGKDKNQAAVLATIGAAYRAAVVDLLSVPVPQTLMPLHLELVNSMTQISSTYADMQLISSDPVRGLMGLKTYENIMDEGARVFTNIAQVLNKDGILFTKDEPGTAWSIFLAPTGMATSS